MEFKKGSTLLDQVYKEGTPTWGCKSGVLDVEDVKDAIKQLKNEFKKGCMATPTAYDLIDSLFD